MEHFFFLIQPYSFYMYCYTASLELELNREVRISRYGRAMSNNSTKPNLYIYLGLSTKKKMYAIPTCSWSLSQSFSYPNMK